MQSINFTKALLFFLVMSAAQSVMTMESGKTGQAHNKNIPNSSIAKAAVAGDFNKVRQLYALYDSGSKEKVRNSITSLLQTRIKQCEAKKAWLRARQYKRIIAELNGQSLDRQTNIVSKPEEEQGIGTAQPKKEEVGTPKILISKNTDLSSGYLWEKNPEKYSFFGLNTENHIESEEDALVRSLENGSIAGYPKPEDDADKKVPSTVEVRHVIGGAVETVGCVEAINNLYLQEVGKFKSVENLNRAAGLPENVHESKELSDHLMKVTILLLADSHNAEVRMLLPQLLDESKELIRTKLLNIWKDVPHAAEAIVALNEVVPGDDCAEENPLLRSHINGAPSHHAADKDSAEKEVDNADSRALYYATLRGGALGTPENEKPQAVNQSVSNHNNTIDPDHAKLFVHISRGNGVDVLNVLREKKIDPNVPRNRLGDTLLHGALRTHFPDAGIIKELLDAGINVGERNSRKETPLHIVLQRCSMQSVGSSELIIRTLLNHGALNSLEEGEAEALFDKAGLMDLLQVHIASSQKRKVNSQSAPQQPSAQKPAVKETPEGLERWAEEIWDVPAKTKTAFDRDLFRQWCRTLLTFDAHKSLDLMRESIAELLAIRHHNDEIEECLQEKGFLDEQGRAFLGAFFSGSGMLKNFAQDLANMQKGDNSLQYFMSLKELKIFFTDNPFGFIAALLKRNADVQAIIDIIKRINMDALQSRIDELLSMDLIAVLTEDTQDAVVGEQPNGGSEEKHDDKAKPLFNIVFEIKKMMNNILCDNAKISLSATNNLQRFWDVPGNRVIIENYFGNLNIEQLRRVRASVGASTNLGERIETLINNRPAEPLVAAVSPQNSGVVTTQKSAKNDARYSVIEQIINTMMTYTDDNAKKAVKRLVSIWQRDSDAKPLIEDCLAGLELEQLEDIKDQVGADTELGKRIQALITSFTAEQEDSQSQGAAITGQNANVSIPQQPAQDSGNNPSVEEELPPSDDMIRTLFTGVTNQDSAIAALNVQLLEELLTKGNQQCYEAVSGVARTLQEEEIKALANDRRIKDHLFLKAMLVGIAQQLHIPAAYVVEVKGGPDVNPLPEVQGNPAAIPGARAPFVQGGAAVPAVDRVGRLANLRAGLGKISRRMKIALPVVAAGTAALYAAYTMLIADDVGLRAADLKNSPIVALLEKGEYKQVYEVIVERHGYHSSSPAMNAATKQATATALLKLLAERVAIKNSWKAMIFGADSYYRALDMNIWYAIEVRRFLDEEAKILAQAEFVPTV